MLFAGQALTEAERRKLELDKEVLRLAKARVGLKSNVRPATVWSGGQCGCVLGWCVGFRRS